MTAPHYLWSGGWYFPPQAPSKATVEGGRGFPLTIERLAGRAEGGSSSYPFSLPRPGNQTQLPRDVLAPLPAGPVALPMSVAFGSHRLSK